MPIGWNRNLAALSNRPTAQTRNVRVRESVFEQVSTIAVSIVADVVTVVHRALEAQVWTRWQTASDESVCPVCGPYHGRVWKAGEGP
ncbi:MAG: hypothetical protein KC438_12445, partial [Thermomicrobiales bacterium]|nr:hypothetical protein [Thermomicrobiales bacterium]